MALDAAISDAQRDRMYARMGVALGYVREFMMLELMFSKKNTDKYLALPINGDENKSHILNIDITRAKIGTDTDINAIVYYTLSDGGGGTGHTISFYMDQARGSKIADLDAATDDDSTGTISPDSSSFFLAGTIDLGTVTGSVTGAFRLVIAPYDRVDDEFDGTELEDSDLNQRFKAQFVRTESALRSIRRGYETIAGEIMLTLFKRVITFASDDNLINPGLSSNNVGGIVNAPSGMLETNRLAMAGNSAGSGEIKVGQDTATPTVAFGGDWTGTNSGIAIGDRVVAGVATLTCTKGLDGRPPQFTALFVPTDPRKELGHDFNETAAEFVLTVGQTWRSQRMGIDSFTLDYLAAVTNDVSVALNATGTNHSVTGLTTANSASGKLFYYYDGTDLVFYSTEAGRDAQDAELAVATFSSPGTATAYSVTDDSGLTLSILTGSALNSGDTGFLFFDQPVPTTPADFFTITLAVTEEPSEFQLLARRGAVGGSPWLFNSGSSPNVKETDITAGFLLGGSKVFGDTP